MRPAGRGGGCRAGRLIFNRDRVRRAGSNQNGPSWRARLLSTSRRERGIKMRGVRACRSDVSHGTYAAHYTAEAHPDAITNCVRAVDGRLIPHSLSLFPFRTENSSSWTTRSMGNRKDSGPALRAAPEIDRRATIPRRMKTFNRAARVGPSAARGASP